MPRPVNHNSKCPRYEYFRARYLAQKKQRKPSEPLPPDPFIPAKDICTSEQWQAAKRPPSSITWIELSTGRSNS